MTLNIQLVDIGQSANDGTGDTIRHAFDKINNNFNSIADNIAEGSQGPRGYTGSAGVGGGGGGGGTGATYNISATSSTNGANLTLSGSDSSVDSVKFAAGTNVTIDRTDVNTITISALSTSAIGYTGSKGVGYTGSSTPASGYTGSSGLNGVTIFIYTATSSSSAPTLNTSGTTTYNILNGTASGLPTGWSTNVPTSGGDYIWVAQYSTASTVTNISISNSLWSSPRLVSKLGQDGSRGTVNIARSISGSSWSNSEAFAAISDAGYGSAQLRDLVTLYNTAAGFSETRYYTGSSWAVISAYVNGNMLIRGTVVADALDVGNNTSGMFINSPSYPYGAYIYQNSRTVYGLRVQNLYSINNGGGAASFTSVYGFTLESVITGTGAGDNAAIAATASSGGGSVRIAVPSGQGGWALYANQGTIGPFTGAHDGFIDKSTLIEQGDILVDDSVFAKSISDVITSVKPSSAQNEKGALGVFVSKREVTDFYVPSAMFQGYIPNESNEEQVKMPILPNNWNDIKTNFDLCVINAVGEGCINVCGENGDIEKGDLIVTSSIPGKGMKQGDDIVRSFTVAKARESITFNSPGEIKQISCIYLCG